MKVFLSWSGDLSKGVATKLKWWLPKLREVLDPYMSAEDIESGERWSENIAKELNDTSVGIICVTRGNVNKPWINFEAGALSKSIDNARVIPLLYNMKKSELKGPLLQFQSVVFDKPGVLKIVQTLNSACPTSIPDADLREIFDVWWPRLQESLKELDKNLDEAGEEAKPATHVNEPEILEELLDLARQQQKTLQSPDLLLPRVVRTYFEAASSERDIVILPAILVERVLRSWPRTRDQFLGWMNQEDAAALPEMAWDLLSLMEGSLDDIARYSGLRAPRGGSYRVRLGSSPQLTFDSVERTAVPASSRRARESLAREGIAPTSLSNLKEVEVLNNVDGNDE